MIKCETIKENIRNIVKGELCEMCHILRWRLQTIRSGRDSTRHVRAVRAMAFARFDIKALAGGCQVLCMRFCWIWFAGAGFDYVTVRR